MNILFIHQYYTTPDMPGSVRSYEMTRRLVAAGHSVVVLSTRRDQYQKTRRGLHNEDGVKVVWLPVAYHNNMNFFQRIKAFLTYAVYVCQLGLKLPADIIVASSTPLTVAIPALILKKIRFLPLTFEVRDLWPAVPIAMGVIRSPLIKFLARWLERTAYQASSKIIALSPGIAAGICSTGIPKQILVEIPNASECERFAVPAHKGSEYRNQFPWLADHPLVLYTGSIGQVNGLAYMVRLAHAMQSLDPEIRFLVVGQGREQATVTALARETGVFEKSMFFLPPVNKSQLPVLLSAATVCSSWVIPVPELAYNSANKFFDALAAGRPMIINHGGWQANLLKAAAAGLVLPAHDPAQAASILQSVLRDQSRLTAMSQSASRLARQFDLNLLGDKFVTAVESVLDHE
tara:strand:+ start:6893 stop:8104 length:1212 start_codon:yes stop_codon:yes gene_type:complete